MLETGGILIVMGIIFALGAAGEWILSLFYRRYLRDTADMGRPGKKLVKLTKLRYETSYYLNGTVHNAKTMVDGMLEHYRLAGLRLWTWHHIATTASFLCGVMGFAIGGAYVVGRYVPTVKDWLPISGINALIYTLAGGALAAMLLFWQHLLDNRTKRKRIESNLVDYFDNEKFHQLGREIALSGRVREITGDRGRREDPGSAATETETESRTESAATGIQGEMEEMAAVAGSMTGTPDAGAEESAAAGSEHGREKKESAAEAKTPVKKASRVMTIGDIIAQGEASDVSEGEPAGNTARGRSGTRKKTAAASTRVRAKNVQIAQEEMEERRSGAAREIIIPLNPGMESTGENGKAEEAGKTAKMEAAATVAAAQPAAKRRRPSGKNATARSEAQNVEKNGTVADIGETQEDPDGSVDRTAREEELLKLLREYMGL